MIRIRSFFISYYPLCDVRHKTLGVNPQPILFMKDQEEDIMPKLLPQLNAEKYEVVDNVWTELASEIQRIRTLISAGSEMKPEDFNKVKTLSKQVRDYGEQYRKAISTQATDYKSKLDEELARLGYGEIETYLTTKRTEQQTAISNRLNTKLTKFNHIVAEELAKTKHLKASALSSYVSNNLAKRFPKLNSGAESKEISNWAPITSVIHMSIAAVENTFCEYPLIAKLPAQSKTLRTLAEYLETGSAPLISNVKDLLKDDIDLLQKMALQERVKTNAATVSEIDGIIKSDVSDEIKIQRVKMLLNVYDTVPH